MNDLVSSCQLQVRLLVFLEEVTPAVLNARGLAESTVEMDDIARGIAESTVEMGAKMRGLAESTVEMGDKARGLADSAVEMGDERDATGLDWLRGKYLWKTEVASSVNRTKRTSVRVLLGLEVQKLLRA